MTLQISGTNIDLLKENQELKLELERLKSLRDYHRVIASFESWMLREEAKKDVGINFFIKKGYFHCLVYDRKGDPVFEAKPTNSMFNIIRQIVEMVEKGKL